VVNGQIASILSVDRQISQSQKVELDVQTQYAHPIEWKQVSKPLLYIFDLFWVLIVYHVLLHHGPNHLSLCRLRKTLTISLKERVFNWIAGEVVLNLLDRSHNLF
jgi:hypothetical protein